MEPVNLQANYFHIGTQPDWKCCKHNIEFQPNCSNDLQNTVLTQIKSAIGEFLFDGALKQLILIHEMELDL